MLENVSPDLRNPFVRFALIITDRDGSRIRYRIVQMAEANFILQRQTPQRLYVNAKGFTSAWDALEYVGRAYA